LREASPTGCRFWAGGSPARGCWRRIAGRSEKDCRDDPPGALEAYRKLKMDGLVDIFVTRSPDEYRSVNRENPDIPPMSTG